tara:strand:- start:1033 stop:1305 length:273 start_codon:yes stop_codon:yes gene_type:complete
MRLETTTTGSVAIFDKPLGAVDKRKCKVFDVCDETFTRFEPGRVKYERWSKFINEDEREVADYYSLNKESVIVLRNSSNGAMRALYHKIK